MAKREFFIKDISQKTKFYIKLILAKRTRILYKVDLSQKDERISQKDENIRLSIAKRTRILYKGREFYITFSIKLILAENSI